MISNKNKILDLISELTGQCEMSIAENPQADRLEIILNGLEELEEMINFVMED